MSNQVQWFWFSFLIIAAVCLISGELWMWHTVGREGTISLFCRYWFDRHPFLFVLLVFAIGLWVGHVGFPTDP
jgi:hypothetical protein